LIPAYEDAFIILERTPLSVERHAEKSNLKDKQERRTHRAHFQQGSARSSDNSLPIKRVTGGWMTANCFCATMTRFG